MSKKKQHRKQCILDATQYHNESPNLAQDEYTKNLSISVSTLAHWEAQGNYQKK